MSIATLTKRQREAVELGDGAHLVTAPPGSGKTEVLVQRVIHLLEQSPKELFCILALTYTVRAANELEERVQQIVPERNQWRVQATTFHSFALNLLNNYGKPVGLKHPITVVSNVEDKRLILTPALEDIIGSLDSVDYDQWKSLFDTIASQKINLIPPERAGEDLVLNNRVPLCEAYDAYELSLINARCVDYEGMVYQAVRLLRVDPWVASHVRGVYRYTLVDEGQELTRGQYGLLKEIHRDDHQNLFIVADVNQSINSFAGGGPEFLRSFITDFTANESQLETNFRSAKYIVDVLENLRNRIGSGIKQLPRSTAVSRKILAPGWVEARSYSDEKSEARAIRSWISSLLTKGLDREWVHEGESTDLVPDNICLLGRTRYGFDPIIAELESHDIPIVLSVEQGALFESRFGRFGYYVLKLMENPRDLPVKRLLLAELNCKDITAGGNTDTIEVILKKLANREDIIPHELTNLLASPQDVQANGLATLWKFTELDLRLTDAEANAWYRDQQLLQHLLRQYEYDVSAPNRSLAGFLRRLSRLEQAPVSQPGVRALTPYRARGLGFKAVVVLGMNEGNFPYYRATSQEQLDEERRAVYVASSRAARALLFTRPRQRLTRYGKIQICQRSRFLDEMALTEKEL